MENKRKHTLNKALVLLSYLAMIVVNVLSEWIPINGVTMSEVSRRYDNLFVPADFTFAIWGLIYFALALTILYMFGLFGGSSSPENARLTVRIGGLFALSSLLNAAWVLCWHYDRIGLSAALMFGILLCLILIAVLLKTARLTKRDALFYRLPFGLYFGWITAATVANVTALLVKYGFSGFGLPEPFWAAAMLIVTLLIAGTTLIRNSDLAYGAAVIWALFGILFRHVSAQALSWRYPAVVVTAAACLVLLCAAEMVVILRRKNMSV